MKCKASTYLGGGGSMKWKAAPTCGSGSIKWKTSTYLWRWIRKVEGQHLPVEVVP